jgi:hypothetical protein
VHETEAIRKEYAEKLKDVKTIYVVGTHYNHNNWNHFSLYFLNENHELERIWLRQAECAYWVVPKSGFRGGYFQCDAWGTDRSWEIVYSLACFLYGWDDKALHKFRQEFLT